MISILKTYVKRFRFLYKLYYVCGSVFINIIKIFVKPSQNTILFVSYGGKKYDDSPKVIYESIINDDRFKNYDFVWAFINTNDFDILKGRKIKIDTFDYYITALKSRIWITNSGVERGLDFKGKKTLYVNTWHGTPLKKMGSDIPDKNVSFKNYSKMKTDIILAQGEYERDIFSKVYNMDKYKFRLYGLPRNDELLRINNTNYKKKLFTKLSIPKNKKIILYAPTYREYDRDNLNKCVYFQSINFNKLIDLLGEEYYILLRMHYEISNTIDISMYRSSINDVSNYENLNDLMVISDMLITDYSSIMFDYSIIEKPIILYTYDFEKYYKERGLYFDIRNELSNTDNFDELIKLIKSIFNNYSSEVNKVIEFRNKYVNYYGNATSRIVNDIYQYTIIE